MIRIIAGKFRGRTIDTPNVQTTKPTMDRVRAGMFSAINFDIYNSVVLDLFAGSGSFGFECLSRGASHASFVELNDEAYRVIQRNAGRLQVINNIEIYKEDVSTFLNNSKPHSYDIIFADPPYKLDVYNDLLSIIINKELLKDNGILILESDNNLNIINPYFKKIKQYKYGLAYITILRK